MSEAMMESRLKSLPLIHRGKVRDLYAVGNDHLLIVTTDRISAFDVILPTPIPGKGEVLTSISEFWFHKLEHIVPNQLANIALADTVPDPAERKPLEGRSLVVKRLEALPIEAVVRGYLIGSGWKAYQSSGQVCGNALPKGLRFADRLPEPIYTPSTKAAAGQHDENVDFDYTTELVGPELAAQVRQTALTLYKTAAAHASDRGIIIADTKFEFGLNKDGELHLIDEVLTPDSSRFWPLDTYRPGINPPSFDKQFVRDYLETLDWNKKAPGPVLPPEVVEKTTGKYREALRRLTGEG